MEVYALATCDTCRAALRALRDAGHAPRVVDVRRDGVPGPTLEAMHAALGPALVNRRSATWRGLSEAERATPEVSLLAAHPTLMKRPVIHAGGRWHLGWGDDVRAALLGPAG